jgi:hypothetical protein
MHDSYRLTGSVFRLGAEFEMEKYKRRATIKKSYKKTLSNSRRFVFAPDQITAALTTLSFSIHSLQKKSNFFIHFFNSNFRPPSVSHLPSPVSRPPARVPSLVYSHTTRLILIRDYLSPLPPSQLILSRHNIISFCNNILSINNQQSK